MVNSKEFINASIVVKKLKESPSDDELLDLYSYYKQAIVGDNNTKKPNFLDFKGTKKWNIWNSRKNLTQHESEVKYITLVNNLIQKYGIDI